MNRDRVRRFIDRCDDPTVPQVLGRFRLPPSAGDEVRSLLDDSNNRARDRQTAPQDSTDGSWGSRGEGEGQEAEKRTTEAGLLRLLRVNGKNSTPSLGNRGRGPQRARIGLSDPEKLAEDGGGWI